MIQASIYLFTRFSYINFLDLDIERNLPTFYSSLAIEFCALLLFIVFIHEKQQKSRDKCHWFGLASIFVFLGLDEGTKLHEHLGDVMESLITTSGLLHFPWVIPYGSALIVLTIFYTPWFLRLPPSTRRGFFTAGFIFIFGALGLETLSAREYELNGSSSVTYTVLYTIEETCEMVGIALFSKYILRHMEETFREVTFKIQSELKS